MTSPNLRTRDFLDAAVVRRLLAFLAVDPGAPLTTICTHVSMSPGRAAIYLTHLVERGHVRELAQARWRGRGPRGGPGFELTESGRTYAARIDRTLKGVPGNLNAITVLRVLTFFHLAPASTMTHMRRAMGLDGVIGPAYLSSLVEVGALKTVTRDALRIHGPKDSTGYALTRLGDEVRKDLRSIISLLSCKNDQRSMRRPGLLNQGFGLPHGSRPPTGSTDTEATR